MITSFIIYVKQNLNEIWIDKMKVSKIWTRSEQDVNKIKDKNSECKTV